MGLKKEDSNDDKVVMESHHASSFENDQDFSGGEESDELIEEHISEQDGSEDSDNYKDQISDYSERDPQQRYMAW